MRFKASVPLSKFSSNDELKEEIVKQLMAEIERLESIEDELRDEIKGFDEFIIFYLESEGHPLHEAYEDFKIRRQQVKDGTFEELQGELK